MHVYVYTYNSHVSFLSSHPISGKRGVLQNCKTWKITDFFFFEKLALCVRIMKFENLPGGKPKLLQFIGCWVKPTICCSVCAHRLVDIPYC